ncbi:MAG: hypothetical protein LBC69_00475 [Eubacteriaceae bacterium]|nr:hypothetical protein [Eubacteriaceae bacterium]
MAAIDAKNLQECEPILLQHWAEMSDGAYFYRGMPSLSLSEDGMLDPRKDEIGSFRQMFLHYIKLVKSLAAAGFSMDIGDRFPEPLERVADAIRIRLENPGAAFTPNYADAAYAATLFRSSQTLHSLRLVSSSIGFHSLPGLNEANREIQRVLGEMAEKPHVPAVAKARKSLGAFEEGNEGAQELNFGSYAFFRRRAVSRASAAGMLERGKIAGFLQRASQAPSGVVLRAPLYTSELELLEFS